MGASYRQKSQPRTDGRSARSRSSYNKFTQKQKAASISGRASLLTLYDGEVLFCVRKDLRTATPGGFLHRAALPGDARGGGKYAGAGLRLVRADFRTATPAAAAVDVVAAAFGAFLRGFTAFLALGSFQGWWWEIATRGGRTWIFFF